MTLRPATRQRLYIVLSHPRLPALLAVGSALLLLPTLRLGFHLDDYFHRYLFSRLPGSDDLRRVYQSPFGIANGVSADNHFQVEAGYAPWWIHPQLLISLFRPLSEASHWLDARLWPASSVMQHAHNLLWYAALVLAATRLYRDVLGRTACAGLSAFMYAFDQAHGFAVGWIANRNALIAAVFGVLTLLFHHRARTDASRRAHFGIALALFACALLSGEGAVAVFGYLLAHALWVERGGDVGRRVLGLWPYAAIVVVWRIGYHALGRGARFSGLYLDPLREPLQFAAAVVERAPLLLLGQLGMPPAEAALFAPALALVIWALALGVALWLAYAVWPLLRADAHARFWAFGMLAALVPACTTHPNNRLLFFVGLGAMPLLAQLWFGFVERAAWLAGSAWRRAARLLAVLLVGFHAVISPLLLPLTAWTIALTAPAEAAARSALAQARGRDLVLVSSPDFFYEKLVPVLAALDGTPPPRHLRALSFGPVALHVTRPDARTLDVRFEGGLLGTPLLELYRARDAVMPAGSRVELDGLRIEVTALTADRRIAAARFTFADALEAAHFCFLAWDGDAYRPFTPPKVGGTAELAPALLRLGR
jgi:hypothetical protein